MALRVATRGSPLALAQAGSVARMLGETELAEAGGDGAAGDKSRFVRGVERAILEGRAEVGVHSAKDLPSEMPEELAIVGVPAREDAADAWIGEASSLEEVAVGARVGTSSLRRRAQLLAARPDLRVSELHGNVDTRLRRLGGGGFDGLVLAVAGLRRLGLGGEIAFRIDPAQMTPASGQGALVLQARRGDEETRLACAAISDQTALLEVTAERAAIARLGGSCATPIGVHASATGGDLAIDGFVGLPDGSEWVRDRIEGEGEAAEIGTALAERLLAAGAGEILRAAEKMLT